MPQHHQSSSLGNAPHKLKGRRLKWVRERLSFSVTSSIFLLSCFTFKKAHYHGQFSGSILLSVSLVFYLSSWSLSSSQLQISKEAVDLCCVLKCIVIAKYKSCSPAFSTTTFTTLLHLAAFFPFYFLSWSLTLVHVFTVSVSTVLSATHYFCCALRTSMSRMTRRR